MTLPRTLSVGRRLSLGVAAAILMLAALVGSVRWNMDRTAEAQAEAMQKVALRQASREVSRRMGQAQAQLHDMLLAQSAEGVAAASDSLRAAEGGAGEALEAVARWPPLRCARRRRRRWRRTAPGPPAPWRSRGCAAPSSLGAKRDSTH